MSGMHQEIVLDKKSFPYMLRVSKRAKRMRLTAYCDGNFVVTVALGTQTTLIEKFLRAKAYWIFEKIDYFTRKGTRPRPSINKKEYSEHKVLAHTLVLERLRHFNQWYGFSYKRITIKNQKTRWGSCSTKGNLNFNYKIALLPAHLADYIIVHELCHIGALNHSRQFWDLVALTIPTHRDLRKELRNYQA
jgi:predicted metal-dependent hydrolase